jgi:hypothetical protein
MELRSIKKIAEGQQGFAPHPKLPLIQYAEIFL